MLTKHAREMLLKFDIAGEWGINRWAVPGRILKELLDADFITKIEAMPRITEAGRKALKEEA